MCPQGNLVTPCDSISSCGQAAANRRIRFRFETENPPMSGKAVCRSAESRSTTLGALRPRFTTPSSCRRRISFPMYQYAPISSAFAAWTARTRASCTRDLMLASDSS